MVLLLPLHTVAQPDPSPSDVDSFMLQLSSDDPVDHEAALSGLVGLGEPAVPELEAIAVDPARPTRERAGAVFALGRIGAERSRSILDELWAEGFEGLGSALAMQAAIALAEFGELQPLRDMVALGDEVLAAKAAVQLGLRRDQAARSLIAEAWDRPGYERMQPFFAIALCLLGDERGVDILRAGLLSLELRNHAAVALSACGHAGDVRFELTFALEDSDPLVRVAALEGLIALEPSNLDELLAEAATDPDPRVRQTADQAARQRRRGSRRP